MKHIVITGGSRGIGLGLAKEFSSRGHMVTISGRNSDVLKNALDSMDGSGKNFRFNGIISDVSNYDDIVALWDYASSFAPVDIWINNAGINHDTLIFHDLQMDRIREVIDTNISGTVTASHMVINRMLSQGFGALYNMEGFGSDGRKISGMSIYGMSKRAVRYFTRSLALDYKNSPILIGSISPGMVLTDMILGPLSVGGKDHRDAIKIFHILADQVETVTPWLVDKILKNKKHGAHIVWLTKRKIAWRFLSNGIARRKIPGLPQ